MKGFALDYLDPIQLAQLQATRPDLHLGIPQCKRCYNGQVIDGQCLQCSAEHDENGDLIVGELPENINMFKQGGFHQRRKS